jgi:hypothetical protein
MAEKLADFLDRPKIFETPFVDDLGNVYIINEVHSNLQNVSRVRQFLRSFKRREMDYGVASCRLPFGIRYTIDLKEHLGDRANPNSSEVEKCEERCGNLITDAYKNRVYLTA